MLFDIITHFKPLADPDNPIALNALVLNSVFASDILGTDRWGGHYRTGYIHRSEDGRTVTLIEDIYRVDYIMNGDYLFADMSTLDVFVDMDGRTPHTYTQYTDHGVIHFLRKGDVIYMKTPDGTLIEVEKLHMWRHIV